MDTISLCNLCLVSWYLVVFWVKTLILYHLSACALRDAPRTPLAPGSHVRAGARRARAILTTKLTTYSSTGCTATYSTHVSSTTVALARPRDGRVVLSTHSLSALAPPPLVRIVSRAVFCSTLSVDSTQPSPEARGAVGGRRTNTPGRILASTSGR